MQHLPVLQHVPVPVPQTRVRISRVMCRTRFRRIIPDLCNNASLYGEAGVHALLTLRVCPHARIAMPSLHPASRQEVGGGAETREMGIWRRP